MLRFYHATLCYFTLAFSAVYRCR